MEPLAYKIRPKDFSDVVGQDHLVGKNGVITRMIEKDQLCSIILYGPPGCGKTTIATIIAEHYGLNTFFFNASVDSKAILKDIVDGAKYYDNCIAVIDEIHRMKKDTQDFLLPYVESGKLIIVGLTTENPYATINPAIRSRCHIYRLNNITEEDLVALLKKTADKYYPDLNITEEIEKYIAHASSCEVRTALNMLETISLLDNSELTLENVEKIIGIKAIPLDKGGDNYYDILSAYIKSIRGSDPDAALHYLARLLLVGDLKIITRRLMCSCYEDIGLGNPQIGPRVYAACMAALELGMPEARHPLAEITVDLALSPKSNSTYTAIDKALDDLEKMQTPAIPKHILNRELKSGKYQYLYPHDFDDDYVVQQYLPDELKNTKYYEPKLTGNYERALKARLDELNRRKNTK